MNSKNRKKWTPFFTIACTLIGAILGSFLVYFLKGEFPYEVLVGGFTAALILTGIVIIKLRRKKDNVPVADERVIRNVSRFFAYTSHTFLAILLIVLSIFTLLGNESISILYLWIFAFAYLWISGIGALIIKKR